VFDILDANGNIIGQVDFDIDVTPEPGTILLLGTGLLLLAGLIRWRVPKTGTMTAA
jgi:PEP-CTERM motif